MLLAVPGLLSGQMLLSCLFCSPLRALIQTGGCYAECCWLCSCVLSFSAVAMFQYHCDFSLLVWWADQPACPHTCWDWLYDRSMWTFSVNTITHVQIIFRPIAKIFLKRLFRTYSLNDFYFYLFKFDLRIEQNNFQFAGTRWSSKSKTKSYMLMYECVFFPCRCGKWKKPLRSRFSGKEADQHSW